MIESSEIYIWFDEYQTSGTTKAKPSLFFSWLKKPFDESPEHASDRISATLNSIGSRLEKVLPSSPFYFPNIYLPEINDWPFSGSVMLH